MDIEFLIQSDLQERLGYWQKRLRLQDWDVEIKVVRHYDTTEEDVRAYVEFCDNKRTARITFVDPADLGPERWPVESLEQSLVHELLHLHMRGFEPKADTPAYTAMEQAVHALAGALTSDEQ